MDNKEIEVYKMKRDSFSGERVVVNIYSRRLAAKIGNMMRSMGKEACNDNFYEEAEILLNAGNKVLKALNDKQETDETTPETRELPLI